MSGIINMEVSVPQLIVLAKDEVAEECLQIFSSRDNSLLTIEVVGTNKSIPEVPGMTCKQFVGNGVAKTPEILDKEDGRCAGITLSERMNLPNSGDKDSDTLDGFVGCGSAVVKLLFPGEVVVIIL